jgi:hypothetical protein
VSREASLQSIEELIRELLEELIQELIQEVGVHWNCLVVGLVGRGWRRSSRGW